MDDGIERVYRRRGRSPMGPFLALAAAGLVVANAMYSISQFGPKNWNVLGMVAWLFVGGQVALEQWRARTTVTADGIAARGPLRTRGRAWADIYGVRVEYSRRGGSHWPAYLYGTDGGRIRLPHLDEHQVADPGAEVADLCATALRLGLTSLETRPEVEERIRRGARRRTASRRAAATALVVALAMFVVNTWLIFTDRPQNAFLMVLGVPVLCFGLVFPVLDRVGETRATRSGTS